MAKTTKDYFEEHRKAQREALAKAGFEVDKLTQAQLDVINEPSEAPENYHQDGEVTPQQAFTHWLGKLGRAGLNHTQVKQAVKLNFG